MPDQIQEIKSKIDIVELISQYVPLKKAGRNYKALCPFHQEKKPSFFVSPELQIFKCFGCNRAGDVYRFIQEMEGVKFPEALRILAEKAGVKLERFKGDPQAEEKRRLLEINHLASEFFSYLLTKHRFGKKALGYLESRGVKDETIKTFDLGYAPRSWGSLGTFLLSKKFTLGQLAASGLIKPKEEVRRKFFDFFRGRLIFPLKDHRGQVIGFSARALEEKDEPKYINTPETLLFKKGSFLYGLNLTKTKIKRPRQAIVVEGEFDLIIPYQAGTKNIVASKGTSLTPGQVRLLKRYADEILLAFDADVAGDEAVQRGIELAQKEGLEVKVVSLPTGKDPDECVRTNPSAWKKALENALPVFEFYFNYALSKWSTQNASGKKQIASYLLPKIKTLTSEVEQTHYLQRLASSLGMGEEILRREMGKLEVGGGRWEMGGRRPAVEISVPKSRQQTLEEYMLTLLLQSPKELARKTLYKLGKDDFGGGETHKLFVSFKGYLFGIKRFELKNLKSKLDKPAQKLLERLYLTPLENLIEDEEKLEKEIELTLKELKKEGLRRKLKNLSFEIRKAEGEGREKDLQDLQKSFQKISEKIKEYGK